MNLVNPPSAERELEQEGFPFTVSLLTAWQSLKEQSTDVEWSTPIISFIFTAVSQELWFQVKTGHIHGTSKQTELTSPVMHILFSVPSLLLCKLKEEWRSFLQNIKQYKSNKNFTKNFWKKSSWQKQPIPPVGDASALDMHQQCRDICICVFL